MKLFYDLRLDRFVAAPGQDTPLASLAGKSGDSATEVVIVFGRSSDPTSASSIVTAPTWTPENLAGGTVIKIGIKEDGVYSDGDLLASNSTWTNNAGAFTYTGYLDLNTEEIDTALLRDDANDANDVESLMCNFELTYQIGGSGGWRSSIDPVPFTLYHDLIVGDEATPTSAADPDEYLLKASAIEYLPTVTSLTGGTSADLDAVPTVAVTVGKVIGIIDADASPDALRVYRLEAGTTAESSPDVIRPDDYATTTNEKVWKLYQFPANLGTSGGSAGDILWRLTATTGYWDAPILPYPIANVTLTTDTSFDSSTHKRRLVKLDTSSGNVTFTLDDTFGSPGDFIWVTCSSASNTATLAKGSTGSLLHNGSNANITIANGVVYMVHCEGSDIWRVLSKS
jgi:hypothetical protein